MLVDIASLAGSSGLATRFPGSTKQSISQLWPPFAPQSCTVLYK